MEPFILTLRAVGAQLAMRLYAPPAIIAITIATLALAGTVWLTTINNWWIVLLIPVVAIFCALLAAAFIVLLLIRYVRPAQNKAQKEAVAQFVNRIQSTTDIVGTPRLVILFRVVRGIGAQSKNKYLSNLVSRRELADDFIKLQQLFTYKNN